MPLVSNYAHFGFIMLHIIYYYIPRMVYIITLYDGMQTIQQNKCTNSKNVNQTNKK